MRRRRWYVGLAVVALAAAVVLWQAWPGPFAAGDVEDDEDGQSTDLAADIKLMWQTEPLKGQHDPSHGKGPRASTDAAIQAASRVFNTVNLVGLTREEVVAKLGDPRTSNDSIYNFPFWPARWAGLVYRFDTGSHGWQFNVYFGWTGKVRKVERLWIH